MRSSAMCLLAFAALVAGCGEPKLTYKGLNLTRPKVDPVTTADVDMMLRQMRGNFAAGTPLTPGTLVRAGHRVVIDFVGTIGGTPFQGGSHSGFSLILGTGQMIPGFEDGIVGMKPGETRDIEVPFPADYQESALAGKLAVFRITLRGGEKLALPPLNEEFARKASGGSIATIPELRKAVRERIYQGRLQQADRRLKLQAAEMLLVQWNEEPTKREVDKALDQVVQQQLRAASQQGGASPQNIPDVESIRVSYGPTVIKNLKLSRILASIAKREGIKISDQEVEQAAAQLARSRGQEPARFLEELKANNQMDGLQKRIAEERAMTLILQNAVIEDAR